MVFEKLQNMISEQLNLSADTVTRESEIIKDLGADSLDIVEMLMNCESTFNIKINDEDVDGLKTIGDVVDFIEKNMK